MKKGLLSKFLVILLTVFAVGTAFAAIPAKSAVNPLTQTLYVVNNGASPAVIRVYQRTNTGWQETANKNITLPSVTAKTFGMTLSPDGRKLFVSIKNAELSKLRIYNLDANGLPNGTSADALNWVPVAANAPAGITLVGNKLYMADSNVGVIHIFENSNGAWRFSSDYSDPSNPGLLEYFDVAATTPAGDGSYKLFLCRKTTLANEKEVFMYSVTAAGAIQYLASVDAATPTQLKVIGNKLYVAVNGAGGDILSYTIGNAPNFLTLDRTFSSGNGAFGITGFDINPRGTALYYTHTKNLAETLTGLYRIDLALPGNNATEVSQVAAGSNGVIFAPDGQDLAVTLSTTGAIDGNASDNASNDNPGDFTVTQPTFAANNAVVPNSTIYGTEVLVTITGSGFLNGATVDLKDASNQYYPLTNVSLISSNQINATVGQSIFTALANSTQGFRVRIRNSLPSGTVSEITSGANAFTINASVAANAPPAVAAGSLSQTTGKFPVVDIPAGGKTNQNSVTFKFNISDPNVGDTLTPQVSIDAGQTWISGNPIVYDGQVTQASVTVSDLQDKSYNWSARVIDNHAGNSPAVSFAGNPDFTVDTTGPIAICSAKPLNPIDAIVPETKFELLFTEAITSLSVNTSSIKAKYSDSATYLPIEVSYDEASNKAIITPQAPLILGKTIEIFVYGKNNNGKVITDLVGNALITASYDYLPFSYTVKNSDPRPIIYKLYPNKTPQGTETSIKIEGINLDNIDSLVITDGVNSTTLPINFLTQKGPFGSDIKSSRQILTTIPKTIPALPIGRSYDILASDGAIVSPNTPADDFTVIPAGSDHSSTKPISNFTASSGDDERSTLSWTNPDAMDLRGIVIVRNAKAAYPADHKSEVLVYTNATVEPGATMSYIDRNLTNGTTYKYAIFTVDTSGNWSGEPPVEGKNAASATPAAPVVAKSIKLEYPVGGETWDIGSQQTIRWTHTGAIPRFTVSISRDNGNSWTLLGTTEGADSRSWTVEGPATGNALIKIEDPATLISDISDAVFTIREAQQNVTVTNPIINRDGNDVVLNWTVNPIGSPVKIYILEIRTDADGNYLGSYTTNPNSWQQIQANYAQTSYTDPGQVGAKTAKYYKVIPNVKPNLERSDLTNDVFGKFDIIVKEGMNLISLPFIPTGGTSLAEIIGTQIKGAGNMEESDVIWKYNPLQPSHYEYAWLAQNTGDIQYDNRWFDLDINPSTITIEPNLGYWLQVKQGNATSSITVVGKITNQPRQIATNIGMNLVGSAWPVSVPIGNSGLNGPATGAGDMEESDVVWKYNLLQLTSHYDFAWLAENTGDTKYDNKWFNLDVIESTMSFEPGKAYWIQVKPNHAGFNWNYNVDLNQY